MVTRPFLIDVRQIGPDKERDVSGVCSACGATVLARLRNSAEKPTSGSLRAELEAVFERHVAEKHPFNGESRGRSVSLSSPLTLPQDEVSRLESLHSFQILETHSEQGFDDMLRLATLTCAMPIGKIGFVDQERVWLKSKIGFELDEIPRERSFTAHAILQPDILLVADALSDPIFANNLLVTDVGVRFFAGMPLITSGRQAIGAVSVMDRVPHLMTAEHMDSLRLIARRIVNDLETRGTIVAQSQPKGLHIESPHHRSVTILIVEDNANLRELLQRTLERHGFSVHSAIDSAEALRWSERQEGSIEILISDIVMPGLNGLELAKRISAVRAETKFLFMTGFGDQFPEVREFGTNVLEKPFLPLELVQKVEDMLNQQEESATGTG
jgi:CheY-like chemotaxis protein